MKLNSYYIRCFFILYVFILLISLKVFFIIHLLCAYFSILFLLNSNQANNG